MNEQINSASESFLTSMKKRIEIKHVIITLLVSKYSFLLIAYGVQVLQYLMHKNNYLKSWENVGFPSHKIDDLIKLYGFIFLNHLMNFIIKIIITLFLSKFLIRIANKYSKGKYLEDFAFILIIIQMFSLDNLIDIFYELYKYPIWLAALIPIIYLIFFKYENKFAKLEKVLYTGLIFIKIFDILYYLEIIVLFDTDSLVPVKEYTDASFLSALHTLCKKTDIDPTKIFIIDKTNKLRAFSYKNLRSDYFIVVFSELYKLLGKDITIGVVSHEIGHVKDFFTHVKHIIDLLKNILIPIILVFMFRKYNHKLGVPITLLYTFMALDVFKFFFEILFNYVSRICEYTADDFSSSMGYAKELYKSFLMIAEMKKISCNFDVNLMLEALSTHPTTMNRINNLLK